MKNTNKAIVTGSCGAIGSAVAKDLAAKGYHLILVDKEQEPNEILAKELPSAEAVTLDLTDRDALRQFCKKIPDIAPEIAFINAGVVLAGNAVEQTEEQLDLQLEVNLRSAIILNRACATDMMKRRNGHIINTVSLGAIVPMQGSACYSASKFGLRGFLASLYSELKPYNVKVSGLYPAAVDTAQLKYEALNNGSVLNFLSPPQTPNDVLNDGFNKALKTGKLEIYIPYSDSIGARLMCVFPSLLDKLYPTLEKRGKRGLARYLKTLN